MAGESELSPDVEHLIGELVEANRALRLAKEQAEQASHVKSEFLSRVSHELRTPLNAILGFGQLMERSPLSASDTERVEQILRAGRHLLSLIDRVLDFGELESKNLTLSVEPVSIAELVADALQLVERAAAERNIRLHAELPDTSGFVTADRIRLGQALGNLLSNAIVYNHDDGQVTVTATRRARTTVLGVTDSGDGIPPEAMDRLFLSPFDRLDDGRIVGARMGLGLILAKSVVEAMHGTLSVESELQVGTAVSIELPSADDPSTRASLDRDGVRSQPDRSAGTVLYIDDSVANLELVKEILAQHLDVTILTARDGRAGIELARQLHPDLVLLDLHLPDMEGEEALALLSLDPATRAIPVVVMSAESHPSTMERLRAAGAIEYVSKPFDIGQFLGLVGDVLAKRTVAPLATRA